ncbi:MAG: CPBP family intramembrane metalloprotease [bacterium]|nr:CPBP family intramembrane metalloprotease [bacterium]
MHDNLFTENLKQSTGMRIFLFLIIFLIGTLIGAAVSALFVSGGDTGMKIGQGVASIFMFVVPPIVYYYITRKENRMQALGLRRLSSPWWLIIVAVALMIVSIPVTTTLTTWNEGMHLGGAFSGIEKWMKELEETAQALTDKMTNVDTIGGLLLNLLVIALIPAVGEEMTFRGVIQQSLTRRMNPHIAIILSAAIFSFFHFQFFGFFPRLFLGILLGYMFYITGSLWTSILMHFVNNGAAVTLYYLGNIGVIEDAEHWGETQNAWIIVASAVMTLGLIIWSWRKRK